MANPDDPDRFKANDAARAMMRSLADRFGVSVPLGVGVLQAASERLLEALRSGRLDLYEQARVDVARAMDTIADELKADQKVLDAIPTVDPRLAEALRPVAVKILTESHRRELRSKSVAELCDAFAKHWIQCKDPNTCAEVEAMRLELKSRGVTIPSWTERPR